jgi:hypothetical protein
MVLKRRESEREVSRREREGTARVGTSQGRYEKVECAVETIRAAGRDGTSGRATERQSGTETGGERGKTSESRLQSYGKARERAEAKAHDMRAVPG